MIKTFNQIKQGLDEALSVARGEAEPFNLHVPAGNELQEMGAALDENEEEKRAEM